MLGKCSTIELYHQEYIFTSFLNIFWCLVLHSGLYISSSSELHW
jgi:hypothetical protein